MAKKKDNTKLLIIGLFGLAAIMLLRQQNRPRYNPQQTYVPPRPVNNTPQAISQWVTTMIQVYGKARELWQPGGPFYKPSPEIQQVLNNLAYMPMPF